MSHKQAKRLRKYFRASKISYKAEPYQNSVYPAIAAKGRRTYKKLKRQKYDPR